ncbi:MAG: hypothetical protein ABL890_01685 [Candidatus Peribacteraceae bacterium]
MPNKSSTQLNVEQKGVLRNALQMLGKPIRRCYFFHESCKSYANDGTPKMNPPYEPTDESMPLPALPIVHDQCEHKDRHIACYHTWEYESANHPGILAMMREVEGILLQHGLIKRTQSEEVAKELQAMDLKAREKRTGNGEGWKNPWLTKKQAQANEPGLREQMSELYDRIDAWRSGMIEKLRDLLKNNPSSAV